MAPAPADGKLEQELVSLLSPDFPGLTVEVGRSERWNRPCVTFRWDGFCDLLPEERFQRLAAHIPEAFREARLAGFVWLELAGKESIESFLSLPRSEDVAKKAAVLHGALVQAGFFDALSRAMGASPDRTCTGAFAQTEAVLRRMKTPAGQVRDYKLLFILHRSYCDCQVLMTAWPALREAHGG